MPRPTAEPSPRVRQRSADTDADPRLTTTRREIDAAAWNALARGPGRADALHAPRVPAGAARLGQRRAPRPAGAALRSLPASAASELRRRLPAVPEEPLLRRVRVRLGLGRRLPAPRPRLLPEAARRGALHAGAGAAPAGARRAHRGAAAARAAAARATAAGCRRRTCCSSTRPTRPARAPTPAGCCAARCSSTGSTARRGLRRLRRLPGQPAARQAQEDPAGAAPRRRGRRRASAVATARRSRAADWDFFYRCYTLTYARAPLDALPDPRLLRPHGADDAASTG